ncbi:LysE family transporter [Corynebacterium ulceribovis]|uniref:LysE family transporter n=1 Tax=Corynebacterium ulceribovis TaxID=487732 RepID=UPI00035E33F4|nr:LysE family translocator [Corynebacterium ulceribovis]
MIWQVIGTIILLNAVAAVSPGPDMFLVLRTGAMSRRHGFAVVAGICTGLVGWLVLTATGMSALLKAYPSLLAGVQVLGGAFLLWMGYHMLRNGLELLRSSVDMGKLSMERQLGTLGHSYRLGLLTNLSNPKAVLFFASILAPFFATSTTWWMTSITVLLLWLSNVLLFALIVMVVSANAVRRRILRLTPWIDTVAGVLFIGVALLLEFEGIKSLLAG